MLDWCQANGNSNNARETLTCTHPDNESGQATKNIFQDVPALVARDLQQYATHSASSHCEELYGRLEFMQPGLPTTTIAEFSTGNK